MNSSITHSLAAVVFFASLTPGYASDPVAYTSLGAQDFLAVYSPTSRKVTERFSAAQNGRSFALSPDGGTAFIGSVGVKAVTVLGGPIWQQGSEDVFNISVSPDSSQVYSVGAGKFLHIYNASTGQVISDAALNITPTQAAATPGHAQIYVSGPEGVDVLDGTNYTLKATINLHGSAGLAVTPDGSRVYVSSTSGKNLGYVIDTTSNKVVAAIPGNSYGAAGAVIFAGDGSEALFATDSGLVEVATFTNTVTGTIASSSMSLGLNLATDGQYAYYTPGVPNVEPALLQFNLAAGVYSKVRLGGTAVGVQYTPFGNAVYLLETLNTVMSSDPVSGTVTSDLGFIKV